MFPDVQAGFPVSPAALRQQIQDRRQFLFDSLSLKLKKHKTLYFRFWGSLLE